MSDQLWKKSISEISGGYRTGEFTPIDLLESILDRIDAVNPVINAIVTLDRQGARQAAEASLKRWSAQTPLGPFDGVPITVKDNIPVRGMRSTWGSYYYAEFVPETDELPVARLRNAGAIILGKTNCPEFTLQGYTDNLLFGPTRNPWNTLLTTGGSSGGAVAAVASGFGPVAIATDGGGSIRRPASYTGLLGLKPSRGRVPRRNGFPVILPDFESVGPITRRVEDLVLTMKLICPPDRGDPNSLPFVERPFEISDAPACRILYIPRFGEEPVDREISESVAQAAKAFADLGHQIEEGSIPFDSTELERASSVIGRAGLAWLIGSFSGNHAQLTAGIAEMAASGKDLLGTEYFGALNAIRKLQVHLSDLFARYDLILTPSAAALPWPAAEPFPTTIGGRKVGPRGHAVFTGFVNMSGCPGISIPGNYSSDKLPIGFQLVAEHGRDGLLCKVAAQFELAHPWHQKRPMV
jgi:aspartyl-tRNA(Asn)/glutamyl-tRNA(Gln) amidotransferase subunit A